jgi:hypothetical protein
MDACGSAGPTRFCRLSLALVVFWAGAALASSKPPTVATPPAPAAAAATPASADPRAHVIGLLALPRVYGTEPCQRFKPEPVVVHASADGARVLGEIRTTSPWRFPPEGGCEGLRVDFVPVDGAPAELPAQEFAYEQPAALVLEARENRYRVRLPAGDGWVEAAPYDEYVPLLAMLRQDLEMFTGAAELRAAPQADSATTWRGAPSCTVPRVRDVDTAGERPWIEVELVRDDCCADDAAATPALGTRGWLPLYREDGVPTVWFVPRGC